MILVLLSCVPVSDVDEDSATSAEIRTANINHLPGFPHSGLCRTTLLIHLTTGEKHCIFSVRDSMNLLDSMNLPLVIGSII